MRVSECTIYMYVQQVHEEGVTMPQRGWENAEQKENVTVSAREQARIIEKGGALLLSRRRATSSKTAVHADVRWRVYHRDTSIISLYPEVCVRVHSNVSFQYTHSHQYTRCHAWSSFHSVSTGGVSLVYIARYSMYTLPVRYCKRSCWERVTAVYGGVVNIITSELWIFVCTKM